MNFFKADQHVLVQEEKDFWNKLIQRYLTPIVDTEAHQKTVTRELKSLRNKVSNVYEFLLKFRDLYMFFYDGEQKQQTKL